MSDARTAILITLDDAHEGGYQRNPKDRANWTGGQVGVGTLVGTKYGITALDMPYGTDIKNLSEAQAVAYYTANYWKPFYSQIVNQPIANKIFDMGVLFGIGTAVGFLQAALPLPVDHSFGPLTLQAVNSADPIALLAAFKEDLRTHARKIAAANPNDAEDLADWERRIDS